VAGPGARTGRCRRRAGEPVTGGAARESRRATRTRAPGLAPLAAALVAVLVAVLVAGQLGTASAARLDLAGDGRWPWAQTSALPPRGRPEPCQVMTVDASSGQVVPVAGATCQITRIHFEPADGPPGDRVVEVEFDFRHTGAQWPNFFRLDLELVDRGFPLGWSWSTTALRAQTGAVRGASCANLPFLTVDTSDVWGPVDSLTFQILEDRNHLASGDDDACDANG